MQPVAGVTAHSSGNHAAAVAKAAQIAHLPCTVVVPHYTPMAKVQPIRSYGANIVFCEPNPTSRREVCEDIARKTGMIMIPPYDHPNTITGQGTIAVEFLKQVPELDAILVPVSGGGMISAIAIASKAIKPNIKIYAVEPVGKNLEACLRSGQRLWPDTPQYLDTIAEGIKTQQLGQLTFPICCELLEKTVFTITDTQMVEAMKFTYERMKLVIEASSAAGVAAVMSDKIKQLDPSIKNIGVILCGGNVDLDKLPWIPLPALRVT